VYVPLSRFPVTISAVFWLWTNVEWILMTFGGGNHYPPPTDELITGEQDTTNLNARQIGAAT